MRLIRSPQALHKLTATLRRRHQTVGFVPTMGYLHEGHLSLVRRAKRENDTVVVSIFVNPLQFGPKEDLKRYPRDLARDTRLLKRVKADILFVPDERTFYPKDFQSAVEVGELARGLCGRSRPTHFKGVATVVAKLLGIVGPDTLYLGQKDFQQFRVVEQMVRDLDIPVRVRMAPIVREKDGLAMSSRNVFLTPAERREAAGIRRALVELNTKVRKGRTDARQLRKELHSALRKLRGGRLDYAEIVDARTLRPMVKLVSGQTAVAAVAVYWSKTRLIDNTLIKVP